MGAQIKSGRIKIRGGRLHDMTMKEAMNRRHTVRKYREIPIPAEIIRQLSRRMEAYNKRDHLAIRLMTEDAGAFPAAVRLFLAKGVRNYFIMAGGDQPELDERLGYCGADLMLYAQTLGLNTWWAGGTYNHKKMAEAAAGARVIGVIAAGYGAVQGKPHKTKKPEEVSSYMGTAPKWFQSGVEAALLAPTALGRQAFLIKGEKDQVSICCDNGIFTGADKGLVKYHFELGAGTENFTWVSEV